MVERQAKDLEVHPCWNPGSGLHFSLEIYEIYLTITKNNCYKWKKTESEMQL